ncbi:MAG: hypothetical protein ACRELB_09670 [Polyangiaceae bacterium]
MKPIAWTLASVASLLGVLAVSVATGGCSSSPETSQCVPQACGNGATLQVCTKTDSTGACKEAGYVVGSQTIYCASCDDCSAAATQANQACSGLPPDDGGSGSSSGGGTSSSVGTTDAGKGTTCSPKVACGTKGVTYEECTTVNPGGACTSIDYQTSDGHKFTCAGCSSCQAAAQQLSAYCAGTAPVDAGTPTTTCSGAVTCGSQGYTYSQCTTTSGSGACQSIVYEATSGVSYACASCGDCTTAYDSMASYCSSMTSPTTSCGSSYSCGPNGATYSLCTTTSGSTCEYAQYETSDGQMYYCNSCSDCTTAYDNVISYCDSIGSTGQQCGSTTCGSAATCCNCSGTPVCYSLIAGETCASIGCQ